MSAAAGAAGVSTMYTKMASVGSFLTGATNFVFSSASLLSSTKSTIVATIPEADRKIMQYQIGKEIRHPLCTAITLAIFHNFPEGTKLGQQNYTMPIQPTILVSGARQSKLREYNQDNHMALIEGLEKDIQVVTEWYSAQHHHIYSIFRLAIWGLKKLKIVYPEDVDSGFRTRVDALIKQLSEACIYKPQALPLKLDRNITTRDFFSDQEFAQLGLFLQIPVEKNKSKRAQNTSQVTASETNGDVKESGASATPPQTTTKATATKGSAASRKESDASVKDHKSEKPVKPAPKTALTTIKKPLAQPSQAEGATQKNPNLPEWLQTRKCNNPSAEGIELIKKELDSEFPKIEVGNIDQVKKIVGEVNEKYQHHMNSSLMAWANQSEQPKATAKPVVKPESDGTAIEPDDSADLAADEAPNAEADD